MAFAAKTPPKKYDTSQSQFMMQYSFFPIEMISAETLSPAKADWIQSSTSRVSSSSAA